MHLNALQRSVVKTIEKWFFLNENLNFPWLWQEED